MSKKVYAHYGQSNGCYQHRILLPTRYCGTYDFPDADFTLSLSDPAEQFPVYHLYGLLTQKTLQCVGTWKGEGGKLVWSVDDLLPHTPTWNPCRMSKEELAGWWLARDVADLIITSTPVIAEQLGRPEKTVVARNLMEVSGYQTTEPAPVQDKVRILWAGSKTHQKDLEIIEDCVDAVLAKHGPEKVEFIFVGTAAGRVVKNHLHRGVHLEDGVSLGLYPKLLKVIAPQIVLAPLDPCLFNHAKSNIRVLEGWSLAAAVVASPVGEYKVIDHGETGLLAATPEEFTAHVDRLVTDAPYREKLARAGRRRVDQIGNWERSECRGEWREAFQKVLNLCS